MIAVIGLAVVIIGIVVIAVRRDRPRSGMRASESSGIWGWLGVDDGAPAGGDDSHHHDGHHDAGHHDGGGFDAGGHDGGASDGGGGDGGAH